MTAGSRSTARAGRAQARSSVFSCRPAAPSPSRRPTTRRPGVERVKRGGIDIVVSDVKMPDLDGLDMLREIKAVAPSPHVITITAFGSIDTAIRAVKLGAFDYITKPFEIDQLLLSVEKALAERALRSEVVRLRAEVQRSYRFGDMVGKSPVMRE